MYIYIQGVAIKKSGNEEKERKKKKKTNSPDETVAG